MLDTPSTRSIIIYALLGNRSRQRPSRKGEQEVAHGLKQTAPYKPCAHPGCDRPVNKATARYCSIRCCALDPVRQERLRNQARRGRIVPLAHQLSIIFQVHPDMEAALDEGSITREDVPAGLQRLRAG